jgi:hypothetical protein
VVALIKRERLAGRVPVSHGGVVAQVWRGGTGRQVPVAGLLAGTDLAALDDGLGRRVGMLLARSGLADAIDAAVVALVGDGDDILTSDPGDLRALAQAAGVHVELIPVRHGTQGCPWIRSVSLTGGQRGPWRPGKWAVQAGGPGWPGPDHAAKPRPRISTLG